MTTTTPTPSEQEGRQAPRRGVLVQMVRGCGTLPHVGEHPGTFYLFIFLAMGALAGAKGGWAGAAGGLAIMALFLVPLYLHGALSRARMSDASESRRAKSTQVK